MKPPALHGNHTEFYNRNIYVHKIIFQFVLVIQLISKYVFMENKALASPSRWETNNVIGTVV